MISLDAVDDMERSRLPGLLGHWLVSANHPVRLACSLPMGI
jgi:hypothetical protein